MEDETEFIVIPQGENATKEELKYFDSKGLCTKKWEYTIEKYRIKLFQFANSLVTSMLANDVSMEKHRKTLLFESKLGNVLNSFLYQTYYLLLEVDEKPKFLYSFHKKVIYEN